MREVPMLPTEFAGEYMTGCGYTLTQPRRWTDEEVEWLKSLKALGYNADEIAHSLQRSKTSVSVKLKRLGKANGSYNRKHVDEKYWLNEEFLKLIEPKSVLDLYCGERSFYREHNATTNDIDKDIKADYHCDAFKLICELYSQGKRYDLIDLDPYGYAYDCVDLAIKMANKGLVITLGELGHKRWKRMDYVRDRYDIETLDEFTIEALIEYIQKIGRRNKKNLKVWQYREWQNIGRVWFVIENIKVTEQWGIDGEEPKAVCEETTPRYEEITLFDLLMGEEI